MPEKSRREDLEIQSNEETEKQKDKKTEQTLDKVAANSKTTIQPFSNLTI